MALQKQMFGYHYDLVAKHPYSSQWWQWPILQIPIVLLSRFSARRGDEQQHGVLRGGGVLNPVVWWMGLFFRTAARLVGASRRNKGYAYFLSPVAHSSSGCRGFFRRGSPSNTIFSRTWRLSCSRTHGALWRVWMSWKGKGVRRFSLPDVLTASHWRPSSPCRSSVLQDRRRCLIAAAIVTLSVFFLFFWAFPRYTVGAFVAAVIAAFIFWYPITAATPMAWDAWNARMLTPIEGNNWINPHPGQ